MFSPELGVVAFACGPSVYGAGADELEGIPPSVCSICDCESVYYDMCGAMCHTCGFDVESKRVQIINFQRVRARLTIADLAERTGYMQGDILAFESEEKPLPDDYFDKFVRVIKAHYADKAAGQSDAG